MAGFRCQRLRSDDVCCRMGGDEFLLILRGCGDDECRRFVKRLRGRWQVETRARERVGAQAVAYLDEILRVLPSWPRDRYLELAPKNWLATRARLRPEELVVPLSAFEIPPPAAATGDRPTPT